MGNTNLTNAKRLKNDEFYTLYKDIENELQYYVESLKGKKIYCNCDNPNVSNFYLYFKNNFESLQLEHLYCTGYNSDGFGYYGEYDGNNEILGSLEGNGDFRSAECIEFLKECDVVVTNPPFSLFREYVAQLMEYGKKFLIIGNGNAVTYKEIFPLIKNNELWLGYKGFSGGMDFIAGNNYDESKCLHPKYDDKGNIIINVMMCVWFTNISHKKHNEEFGLYRKYNETDYPKYDNYDAINVDKVKDIPIDYDGVMGVPITFLQYYNPSQFEILGCCQPAIRLSTLKLNPKFKEYKSRQIVYNGNVCQKTYHRLLIKKKR